MVSDFAHRQTRRAHKAVPTRIPSKARTSYALLVIVGGTCRVEAVLTKKLAGIVHVKLGRTITRQIRTWNPTRA